MARGVGIKKTHACDSDDNVWEHRHGRRAKIVGVGDVVVYRAELRAGNCARRTRKVGNFSDELIPTAILQEKMVVLVLCGRVDFH